MSIPSSVGHVFQNRAVRIGGTAAAVVGLGVVAAACGGPKRESIDALASKSIDNYDINGDGRIAYRDGLEGAVAVNRFEPVYPDYRDGIDYFRSYDSVTDATRLFRQADQVYGNNNGVTTANEVGALMKTYDTGVEKDGQIVGEDDDGLEGDEREDFNREWGPSRYRTNERLHTVVDFDELIPNRDNHHYGEDRSGDWGRDSDNSDWNDGGSDWGDTGSGSDWGDSGSGSDWGSDSGWDTGGSDTGGSDTGGSDTGSDWGTDDGGW